MFLKVSSDFFFPYRGNTMSCLFLSRTFHEREKIEEVSVENGSAPAFGAMFYVAVSWKQ